MTTSPRSPHDFELRELTRRAELQLQSIYDQLSLLECRDFPTDSPRQFIVFMRGIVGALRETLHQTVNCDLIRFLSSFSKELSSHVRFLETASYPQIPWAMIGPMERVITTLIPNSRTVLRAQWEYNYKIRWISETYRAALEALPRQFLQPVLFEPSVPTWTVVSLPAVDKDNVLMHVILGHEVGHKVAHRFLEAEDRQLVQAAVQGEVGNGQWFKSDIDGQGPLFALQVKQALYDRILEMRNRGLKELISDQVGLSLFGPSLLFALREVALDDVLDSIPSHPQYYPPWRYRLRAVWRQNVTQEYVAALTPCPSGSIAEHARAALQAYAAELERLVGDKSDEVALAGDKLASRAYRLIDAAMGTVSGFIAKEVGALGYAPRDPGKRLSDLLDRLAHGIPPTETASDGLAEFRDALLAGWLYKLGQFCVPFKAEQDGSPAHGTIDDDGTLHRLVHKAIEQGELAKSYAEWSAKGDVR